jgi:hypothetical protein
MPPRLFVYLETLFLGWLPHETKICGFAENIFFIFGAKLCPDFVLDIFVHKLNMAELNV